MTSKRWMRTNRTGSSTGPARAAEVSEWSRCRIRRLIASTAKATERYRSLVRSSETIEVGDCTMKAFNIVAERPQPNIAEMAEHSSDAPILVVVIQAQRCFRITDRTSFVLCRQNCSLPCRSNPVDALPLRFAVGRLSARRRAILTGHSWTNSPWKTGCAHHTLRGVVLPLRLASTGLPLSFPRTSDRADLGDRPTVALSFEGCLTHDA